MQQGPTAASRCNARRPDRITYLRVENFRALRRAEFKDLTPLTVLLGPNGTGKSTAFAFRSECFEFGFRRAWDWRGRAKELKTRGSQGTMSDFGSYPLKMGLKPAFCRGKTWN